MGAQKKCHLLIGTIISFLFCLLITYLILDEYYFSEKEKKKNKIDSDILWVGILLIISIIIWLYLLYKTFKKDIKFILVSKQKSSDNNINNINSEINNFIKRAEYKFTKTRIKRKNFWEEKNLKKKITCITVLNNSKILLGFSEGSIMLCLIDNNYELKQIFSFNKYKDKKILYISESLKYKNEFMISIKANLKPLKLIKFNLDYKYSLIKVLARDKAYLVLKEFGNKKWKNVYKIISYENGQFLIIDRKGIYIKEKINVFNHDDSELECDEYQITHEYIINNESNREIYDVIKIDEESFASLERENNLPNLHFYKLHNLQKERDYIPNIITSRSLSNRLCHINQFLLAVFDSNEIIIINAKSKQKVKNIKLENIQKSGFDSFYDGNIIFIINRLINGYQVPHIVKLNIINENEKEDNSYNLINMTQYYKNEEERKELIGSKIKVLKCLKNRGILIFANSQGKLFIWEDNNINKETIKINNLY